MERERGAGEDGGSRKGGEGERERRGKAGVERGQGRRKKIGNDEKRASKCDVLR